MSDPIIEILPHAQNHALSKCGVPIEKRDYQVRLASGKITIAKPESVPTGVLCAYQQHLEEVGKEAGRKAAALTAQIERVENSELPEGIIHLAASQEDQPAASFAYIKKQSVLAATHHHFVAADKALTAADAVGYDLDRLDELKNHLKDFVMHLDAAMEPFAEILRAAEVEQMAHRRFRLFYGPYFTEESAVVAPLLPCTELWFCMSRDAEFETVTEDWQEYLRVMHNAVMNWVHLCDETVWTILTMREMS